MYYSALEDAATQTGGFASFIPIIVIIGLFVLLYFFTIRPQRKQEKEAAEMRNNLKVNDEIVTIGGIVGIITNVSGKDTITIVTSRDKTRIQILRSAVSRVQVPAEETDNSQSSNS